MAAKGGGHSDGSGAQAWDADDGDLVPFVAFECRGIEPTAWHPTGGYCATSNSNQMYEVRRAARARASAQR